MRSFAILTLLCTLSVATPLFGTTFYVNNIAGNDLNSGTLPSGEGEGVGPLRTIQAALRRTQRGDRIELANTGIAYPASISLQGPSNSGYAFAPFVLDGKGATLDGSIAVPANQWELIDDDVYRFQPDVGGYQTLLLDGEPAKSAPRFDGSYLSTFLEPKQWCGCRGGIHFRTEEGKSPYAYDLRYGRHRVGITLYNVRYVVIKNLTVNGFQLDGINAHDNAMECVLDKVTCVANGRSGIAVNGASRVKIIDCRASGNGEVELRCDQWSTTHVINSRLRAEGRPIWTRHVNQAGRGARLFVDETPQFDLHGWWVPAEEDEAGDEELKLDDSASSKVENVPDVPSAPEINNGPDVANETPGDAMPPAEQEADVADEEPLEADPFGADDSGFDALDPGDAADEADPFDDIF